MHPSSGSIQLPAERRFLRVLLAVVCSPPDSQGSWRRSARHWDSSRSSSPWRRDRWPWSWTIGPGRPGEWARLPVPERRARPARRRTRPPALRQPQAETQRVSRPQPLLRRRAVEDGGGFRTRGGREGTLLREPGQHPRCEIDHPVRQLAELVRRQWKAIRHASLRGLSSKSKEERSRFQGGSRIRPGADEGSQPHPRAEDVLPGSPAEEEGVTVPVTSCQDPEA
jgi:hypothetical protein